MYRGPVILRVFMSVFFTAALGFLVGCSDTTPVTPEEDNSRPEKWNKQNPNSEIRIAETDSAVRLSGDFLLAPSNLILTLNENTQSIETFHCILIWVDNSHGEQGFVIERQQGIDGEWRELSRVEANQTVFTDLGLSPHNAYSYRIKAFNDRCCSNYSNEPVVRTGDAPELPDKAD